MHFGTNIILVALSEILYRPEALLFFHTATPFQFSSSLKRYTMEASPSVAGGRTEGLALDGILHLPLTRSWSAALFVLTRHGGVYVVGSFGSFLIGFQAL